MSRPAAVLAVFVLARAAAFVVAAEVADVAKREPSPGAKSAAFDRALLAFSIDDDLKLGPKKTAATQAATPTAAPARKPAAKPKQTGAATQGGAARGAADASAQHKPTAIALKIADGENVEQAWADYFAQHEDVPPADVRETVRQLTGRKKFDQVAALIQGALRAGEVQPWMYEALGLALQGAGAPKEEVERALMSAVDFSERIEDLMYVAQYLARLGLEDRAIQVFRQVATLDPSRPEPFAFGLQLAQRLGDGEAIRWASLGVLSQAWPREKRELEQTAYRAIQAEIERLKSEHDPQAAARLSAEFEQALVRDCVVTITWTGDADVDLFVEEPAGTICSFRNPHTTSGGMMFSGALATDGAAQPAGTTSETYVCSQAFSGNYKLLLRRVWGKVTAGKVTVDIYTHFGSKDIKHLHHQMPLGDQDAVAVFDLTDGRRRESLGEQQVANAAVAQVALNQAILNQTLNGAAATTPGVGGAYGGSRAGLFGAFPFIQQAVGYQPVIITLPAGANSSATGVISADRRYVRVTVLPLFSQIGMVTTFNITTGAVGSSPTPPAGGGGVSGGTNGFPPTNTGTGT